MKVLHAAAELYPYVKVGGLADVMGSLPPAQAKEGIGARLLLPAYPALRNAARVYGVAADFPDLMGGGPARLLLAEVSGGVPLYLLDAPSFFDRGGSPYDDWGDSHRKFAALAWAAAQVGLHGDTDGVRPDVLHLHDWQTALAAAFLAHAGGPRPKTVLTIHNLAYQGVFPRQVLEEIWLPREAFHMDGAEYYGQVNFLKAGLSYADRIATVSPSYAKEIQTPEGGHTLEGTLSRRSGDILGILNGVDEMVWNPAKDPHIWGRYTAKDLKLNKAYNKKQFQREMDLGEGRGGPLFGIVSRFDSIKGLDLVLPNIDYMVSIGAQLAVIGRGDAGLESAFAAAAAGHPGAVAAFFGHDEGLAHKLMAASDVLLVPSRSEPCGLTQLYAMRYGSLPLARRIGGLADTVIDATYKTVKDGTATGFLFFEPDSWHLGEAITRAVTLYKYEPEEWHHIQLNAMAQQFTWSRSAKQYAALYESLLEK